MKIMGRRSTHPQVNTLAHSLANPKFGRSRVISPLPFVVVVVDNLFVKGP